MRLRFRVLSALALASLTGFGGCVGTPEALVDYTPPAQDQQSEERAVTYGFRCRAGFYACSLAQSVPVGSGCSCPGLGAPSFGTVR